MIMGIPMSAPMPVKQRAMPTATRMSASAIPPQLPLLWTFFFIVPPHCLHSSFAIGGLSFVGFFRWFVLRIIAPAQSVKDAGYLFGCKFVFGLFDCSLQLPH